MAIKRWDGTQWVQQASNGGLPLGYDYATVVTSAGTDTLNYNSQPNRFYTGTTTHTVVLPSTSVVAGQQFIITNNSTGVKSAGQITVNASNGVPLLKVYPGQSATITAISNTPTTTSDWVLNKPYVATSNGNFNGTNITFTTSQQTLLSFTLDLPETCIVGMFGMVQMNVSASANYSYVGWSVSGATTIGYNANYSAIVGNTNGYFTVSPIRWETLNAGTNTLSLIGVASGAGTWTAINTYGIAIPLR